MTSILPTLRRALFALGTVAALGFGATQAVAAPQERDAPGACTGCRTQCPGFGGSFINGRCACCG